MRTYGECRRYRIRTVFTTIATLRGQLTKVKDEEPLCRRALVDYRITCRCSLEYIRKTKRILEIRLQSHHQVREARKVGHSRACLDKRALSP